MSQSARRMIVSSCSTTTTVLPRRLQIAQGIDKPLVVARMQADGGLVEHIAHADQARTQPGGQAHALQFAAAEGARRPVERQICQADAVEKLQPRDDLADESAGRRPVVRRRTRDCAKNRRAAPTVSAVTAWIALPAT